MSGQPYLTNQHCMISNLYVADSRALELRENAGEQRHARFARMPVYIDKAILGNAGKPMRQIFLVFCKYVHSKPGTSKKVAEDGMAQIDGNKDQRRVK